MKQVDDFINQVKILPPAPRTLTELLPLLNQADVPAGRVVEVIRYDPVLTAKILRRCNSAAFGLNQPVDDLLDALVRLGFNEVYRLAAVAIAETTLGGAQPGYGFNQGNLWEHSVVTALGSRFLARSLGSDENQAFTAALLHDIGKTVLSNTLEKAYTDIMKETQGSGHSLVEAEKILIGVEHAEIGGRLLERWGFPENLVRSVWYHHDPLQAQAHKHLAACIYVGDLIAHMLGYAEGHQAYAVRSRAEAMHLLEISAKEIELLMLQTDAALETMDWFTRKAT
jgi:putative nucleotidyltransferase with HDIG domain